MAEKASLQSILYLSIPQVDIGVGASLKSGPISSHTATRVNQSWIFICLTTFSAILLRFQISLLQIRSSARFSALSSVASTNATQSTRAPSPFLFLLLAHPYGSKGKDRRKEVKLIPVGSLRDKNASSRCTHDVSIFLYRRNQGRSLDHRRRFQCRHKTIIYPSFVLDRDLDRRQ